MYEPHRSCTVHHSLITITHPDVVEISGIVCHGIGPASKTWQTARVARTQALDWGFAMHTK